MSSTPPARKRTQFASFLTEASSDLSGFEPAVKPPAQPAEPDAPSTSTNPSSAGPRETPEAPSPPADRAQETGDPGLVAPQATEKADMSSARPSKISSSPSATQDGSPRDVEAAETVKISVKVDARTFLRLKRSLELRETLQDFCLNAIKAELATRIGNA